MDNGDGKNQVAHRTSVGDLERLVRVRKYRHCEAEYSHLAKEPNTMSEVRDRYLRIAQYYRELAETEPLGTSEAKPAENARGPRGAAVFGSGDQPSASTIEGPHS